MLLIAGPVPRRRLLAVLYYCTLSRWLSFPPSTSGGECHGRATVPRTMVLFLVVRKKGMEMLHLYIIVFYVFMYRKRRYHHDHSYCIGSNLQPEINATIACGPNGAWSNCALWTINRSIVQSVNFSVNDGAIDTTHLNINRCCVQPMTAGPID